MAGALLAHRAGGNAFARVVAAVNVLTNGDFSAGTAAWTGFGFSGKSVAGGKFVMASTPAYDPIYQTVSYTTGKYYELTLTISSYSSGVLVIHTGAGGTTVETTARSASGTFVERVLVNPGNTDFEILLTTGGSMSVDDVTFIGPYDTATVGGA